MIHNRQIFEHPPSSPRGKDSKRRFKNERYCLESTGPRPAAPAQAGVHRNRSCLDQNPSDRNSSIHVKVSKDKRDDAPARVSLDATSGESSRPKKDNQDVGRSTLWWWHFYVKKIMKKDNSSTNGKIQNKNAQKQPFYLMNDGLLLYKTLCKKIQIIIVALRLRLFFFYYQFSFSFCFYENQINRISLRSMYIIMLTLSHANV